MKFTHLLIGSLLIGNIIGVFISLDVSNIHDIPVLTLNKKVMGQSSCDTNPPRFRHQTVDNILKRSYRRMLREGVRRGYFPEKVSVLSPR